MTYAIILLSLIDALQTWPNRSKEANRFARWFLDRGLVAYGLYKAGITVLILLLAYLAGVLLYVVIFYVGVVAWNTAGILRLKK